MFADDFSIPDGLVSGLTGCGKMLMKWQIVWKNCHGKQSVGGKDGITG